MKKLKRMFALTLILCMALTGVMPVCADKMTVPKQSKVQEVMLTEDTVWQDPVVYYAYDPDMKELFRQEAYDYTLVDSDCESLTLNAGQWYVIDGTVTIKSRVENNSQLTNPANIILKNGCTLNAPYGIENGSRNSLHIYGQGKDGGDGQLKIDNVPENCAGIGGGNSLGLDDQGCGYAEINGGILEIHGGKYGAGIGGGNNGGDVFVTINAGTVNAYGGESGAGIGGGNKGINVSVTINAGKVAAYGGIKGAGIGTGNGAVSQTSGNGKITINGGTSEAFGGEWAAGIGCGYHGYPNAVEITGGDVTAVGGSRGGAGIGGGKDTSGADTKISGGTVCAIGNVDASYDAIGCGIGRGTKGYDHRSLTITGKQVNILSGTGDKDATVTTADTYVRLREPYVLISAAKSPVYTVTWMLDDGSMIDTADMSEGEMPVHPDPVKDGCIFTGWTPALSPVTGDVTYIARFYELPHEHSFSNDWSSDETNHWRACTCGHAAAEGFGAHDYNTTKEGYFTKYTCKVCGCEKYEKDADACTVTFDMRGFGDEVPGQIVKKNGYAVKPSPDPSDVSRIFGGWYEDAECIHEWDFEKYTVSGDTIIYAKWIPTSCTLRLYLGDEKDTRVKTSSAHYGQTLPDITPPTREGLVFLGYYVVGEMGTPSVQYYNAYGKGITWDIETPVASLIAFWAPGTLPPAHEHTFADIYTHNDTHHWRVCTCGDENCNGNVTGFAAHTFGEGAADGSKTVYTCVCGYTKVVYDKPDDEGEMIGGTSYTGISLTLSSDISINFYMELTEDARQKGTMTFDIGGRIVTADGKNAKYNPSEKKYYFSAPLTALEMNETVTAAFTYNGVEYVQEYSVAEYIEKILGGTDKDGKPYSDEMKLLAKKIANYGCYAQEYLASIHSNVTIGKDGYEEMFKCADADISSAAAKEALAKYSVQVTGTSDNLSLCGSTVYLDAATALNYYVTVKDGGKPTAAAINTVTGKEKDVEIKLYKDNIYIVSVKDIKATELADDIKVTINGEITLDGSVFAYCSSVVKAHSGDNTTDKDTLAVNAMAAFYEYYDAAVEYAKTQYHRSAAADQNAGEGKDV